jgi:hypothetical protein
MSGKPETPPGMADLFDTPREEQARWDAAKREALQLAMARLRFETQVPMIPQLKKLAELQNVADLGKLDDLAPLLFRHTVYKSYPISMVTRGRFDLLTKWLDGLTVHDLSGVDVSQCDSFDSWFVSLEAQSPLRPIHSTGTTGKLSIMPRGIWETDFFAWQFLHSYDTLDGSPNPIDLLIEANGGGPVPIVHPSYRHGRHLAQRMMDALVSGIGSEETTYVLNTDYLSADLMSLVGQVRGASQRGELDKLEIAPALLDKYRAMVSGQQDQQEAQMVFSSGSLKICSARQSMSSASPRTFTTGCCVERSAASSGCSRPKASSPPGAGPRGSICRLIGRSGSKPSSARRCGSAMACRNRWAVRWAAKRAIIIHPSHRSSISST